MPKTEAKLLDAFTLFCELHETQDVHLQDLKQLFQENLHINKKLIQFINLDEFRLEASGNQDLVDFEKYLYNSALLLNLSQRLEIIDFYWELVLANIKGKGELTPAERKSAYQQTLDLKDIEQLSKNLKQAIPMDILMNMITLCNEGERVYLNYMDFALILGRVGELGES
ncbi:hypothetical protein FOA43_000631 [Brettanomyces nanus]|uniref:Uncharacterized protein n=1 Tax=Eeniella nana TaxID=13502 RepID=A0A875RW28_EENNA|nr:uncharacterized protein FOA43_000631 [Brettanomyces nanus]QPG73321.1 hypothetical protein FOA43_000631 [Brettanomyces nanus]